MTPSEFSEAEVWGGRPVARKISDALPRGRVVIRGAIIAAGITTAHGTPSYECTLDDDTGQIGLLFLGRRAVRGLEPGTVCTVEGTATSEGGRLVVWNPIYRIEATGC